MSSPQELSETNQPGANDVLLGRASRIYNHPGNLRYRCFINSNQNKYHACKTRLDKMIFIRNMTKEILDDGRVKFWKNDKKRGTWKEVDFRTVQDKVSHALRDSKGCSDTGIENMLDYCKTTEAELQPLNNPNSLMAYLDLSQEVRARAAFRGQATPSEVLSGGQELGLEQEYGQTLARLQELQDLKQQHAEEKRDLLTAALHQRRLSLASMAGTLATQNPAHGGGNGLLRDLPPYAFQPRMPPNQFSAPSLLLEENLINQSNNLNQQLSSDDLLLHAMRRSSSGGLGQVPISINVPTVTEDISGAMYHNQQVHQDNRLRKNIDGPLAGGDPEMLVSGRNLMESVLSKLKSTRTAELQLVEQRLRQVQN